MKKSDRITAYVSQLETASDLALDPHYLGYFKCFNEQDYYEAHDVLEHLWLQKKDENHHFFKGLIQVAGAFVHLKKQHARPDHHKDGRRLAPASRLFKLAMHNLKTYRPHYMHLDVDALHYLCEQHADRIIQSEYQFNPWSPAHPPQIRLMPVVLS